MIEQVTIENFKGIRKGRLRLSPITILLGPNNAGKSTILEALFLAPNPIRKVPFYLLTQKHMEGPRDRALSVTFFLHQTLDYHGYAFLFHNYSSKYSEIKCLVKRNEYRLRFINKNPLIYLITNRDLENYGTLHTNGEETRFFATVRFDNLNLTSQYTDQPFMEETLMMSPTLTKMGYEHLRQEWGMIINKRITRKVAEDTSMFSHETYRDFTIEPVVKGQLDIHAYLDDGRRIRLGDLGEGIQSYALARILYEVSNPEILLWDDIESHLNPRILIHIADWFSELLKKRKQVILSTHSLEAAKIVAGVNEEKTGIYLTSLEDSTLKTKRLTLSEVEKLQDAGIDARTAEAVLL